MRGRDIARTSRARALRGDGPEAEKRLWGALRGRRLANFKFVRQEPIGPFFVDFLCRGQKLVIEVDGATHASDEEIGHDIRRDAFFRGLGYQILRVGNRDIYENLDGVAQTILAMLEARD